MYDTAEFRKGLKIEVDGIPYLIVDFQHVKPGKGGAFVRTKLKNLMTSAMVDKTFRAGEKVSRPDLETKEMQFLYKDEASFHFMDLETYDQLAIPPDHIEATTASLLKENTQVAVLFYRGIPLNIELPTFLELTIVETDPGLRGDTASGGSKPAKLETGAIVQVPLYLKIGDIVKVDTRTVAYVEKVR
ncbi:MAG: elongation factor P [Deltaproteobacteria bacterium]|nr:elongation factor P [Deltaproteobacteria bacterium]